MLFLTFQLGADTYAIDADRIVEVLPVVQLKPAPHAPPGVAGFFNHRGVPLVAVDLSAMVLQRPSQLRISTRIVLMELAGAPAGGSRKLGVIVERATEVMQRAPSDFVETGYRSPGVRYLGPVATLDDGRMVQRIDPRELIPADVLDALYAVAAAS